MSEMIEMVMKAIDEASTYGEGPRWRQELPNLARAAIEAMREPTKEMLSAGEKTFGDSFAVDHTADLAEAWPAMIDTALGVHK
jgi:hypothetical protein